MPVAAVLVLLFAIFLAAANHALWLATTTIDEDQFVATLRSLPQDPAVAAALGTEVATSIVENNDIESRLSSRLPDGIDFLAAPLTTGIENVITNVATDIISSDQFDAVWGTVLRVTHRATLAVLTDDKGLLQTTDGEVVLDFSPIVAQVNERLMARGIDVLNDRDIDATIEIYDSENLGLAQWIAEVVYAIRWIAPIGALLFLIGALLVASERRTAVVWLGASTIVVGLLMLIEMRYLRATTLDAIVDPINQDGVAAAWSIVFNRFIAQTWALVVIGIIVTVVGWLMGRSDRAAATRAAFSARRDAARMGAEPSPLVAFVERNLRLLEWLVIAGAAAFLLWVSTVTAWLVILVAIVVIAGVAVLEWLGGGNPSPRKEQPT
jgi:hypothetical protein